MRARPRLLVAAALALAGSAHAGVPCDGWEGSESTLELHGANGHVVLRAAPEALAALRRTLLAHCGDPQAARPPLDIGPVEIDAELVSTPQEKSSGVLELKVRMRADRLQLKMQ
jgi:hypothetical protein